MCVYIINLIAVHTANHEERSTFFRADIVITRIIQYPQSTQCALFFQSFNTNTFSIRSIVILAGLWSIFRPPKRKKEKILTNH